MSRASLQSQLDLSRVRLDMIESKVDVNVWGSRTVKSFVNKTYDLNSLAQIVYDYIQDNNNGNFGWKDVAEKIQLHYRNSDRKIDESFFLTRPFTRFFVWIRENVFSSVNYRTYFLGLQLNEKKSTNYQSTYNSEINSQFSNQKPSSFNQSPTHTSSMATQQNFQFQQPVAKNAERSKKSITPQETGLFNGLPFEEAYEAINSSKISYKEKGSQILELAKTCLTQGKLEQSAEFGKNTNVPNKERGLLLVELAEQYFLQGDYENAHKMITDYSVESKTRGIFCAKLAEQYFLQGDYENAHKMITDYQVENKTRGMFCAKLAEQYFLQGDYENAHKMITDYQVENKTRGMFCVKLAEHYFSLGDYEMAVKRITDQFTPRESRGIIIIESIKHLDQKGKKQLVIEILADMFLNTYQELKRKKRRENLSSQKLENFRSVQEKIFNIIKCTNELREYFKQKSEIIYQEFLVMNSSDDLYAPIERELANEQWQNEITDFITQQIMRKEGII